MSAHLTAGQQVTARSILMVAAALAGLLLLAAIGATGWLMRSQPPAPADLIVVLAGGSGERVGTSLELYRAGYAPRILVTSPHGYPAQEMERFVAEGVPEEALVPPLRPSDSTLEDARAIAEIARRLRIRSLLVVTSPYHCRRARFILSKVLARSGVAITVTASASLYMDPQRWWLTRQGWITVPGEYPKLLWAWLSVREGEGKPGPDVTGTP